VAFTTDWHVFLVKDYTRLRVSCKFSLNFMYIQVQAISEWEHDKQIS